MMNISKVLEKRLRKNRNYFKRLKHGFNTDDVHEFRLQIKKLRALLRLVNSSLPEEKKLNIDKDLKEYYNLTGNIRNLQLHIQRVKYLCKDLFIEEPVNYLDMLSSEEDVEIKKTKEVRPRISFRKFRKTTIEVISSVTDIDVPHFLAGKLDSLDQLLQQPVHTDEALHEVRKILKDLLYDGHFIDVRLLPAPLSDPKFIDSLADKLGNFHDLCISVLFFQKKYIDKIKNEPEKKVVIAIMQQLEWRKGEMKDELIDQLGNLRSAAF